MNFKGQIIISNVLLSLLISLILSCSDSPFSESDSNSKGSEANPLNNINHNEGTGGIDLAIRFSEKNGTKAFMEEATNEIGRQDINTMDYEIRLIKYNNGVVEKEEPKIVGTMSTLNNTGGSYSLKQSIVIQNGTWRVLISVKASSVEKFSGESGDINVTSGPVVNVSVNLLETSPIQYGDPSEYGESSIGATLDRYPYFEYINFQNVVFDQAQSLYKFDIDRTINCRTFSPFIIEIQVCNPGKMVKDLNASINFLYNGSSSNTGNFVLNADQDVNNSCGKMTGDFTNHICSQFSSVQTLGLFVSINDSTEVAPSLRQTVFPVQTDTAGIVLFTVNMF